MWARDCEVYTHLYGRNGSRLDHSTTMDDKAQCAFCKIPNPFYIADITAEQRRNAIVISSDDDSPRQQNKTTAAASNTQAVPAALYNAQAKPNVKQTVLKSDRFKKHRKFDMLDQKGTEKFRQESIRRDQQDDDMFLRPEDAWFSVEFNVFVRCLELPTHGYQKQLARLPTTIGTLSSLFSSQFLLINV